MPRSTKVLAPVDINAGPVPEGPPAAIKPPPAAFSKKEKVGVKELQVQLSQKDVENDQLKAQAQELATQLEIMTQKLAAVQVNVEASSNNKRNSAKGGDETISQLTTWLNNGTQSLISDEYINTIKASHTKAPKRPTSAFLYFSAECRKDNAQQLENMSLPDQSKFIGAQWKAISENQAAVKKFATMAEKDKKRYEKEMIEYKKVHAQEESELKALEYYATISKQQRALEFYNNAVEELQQKSGSDKKKKVRDEHMPKRAMNPYMFFSIENSESFRKANPEKSAIEVAKLLGEEWKKLEAKKNGRKKWEDLAAKDKERYEQEMAEYKRVQALEEEEAKIKMESNIETEKKLALEAYSQMLKDQKAQIKANNPSTKKKASASKKPSETEVSTIQSQTSATK